MLYKQLATKPCNFSYYLIFFYDIRVIIWEEKLSGITQDVKLPGVPLSLFHKITPVNMFRILHSFDASDCWKFQQCLFYVETMVFLCFFVFWFCSWSEFYIEKLLVSSEISYLIYWYLDIAASPIQNHSDLIIYNCACQIQSFQWKCWELMMLSGWNACCITR